MLDATSDFPTPDRPSPNGNESEAECRARFHAQLKEMAELGMIAARAAVKRIEHNQSSDDDAEPAPSLTFARASNVVRQAIALEQKLLTPAPKPRAAAAEREEQAPSPAAADPRRVSLRDALRKAAFKLEPDRNARNQLCRNIDERLDARLLADPHQQILAGDILMAVARACGIPMDISQLPDELLGIAPHQRRRPPPPSNA